MRLVDNPFYILGVEPTDDVGTIQSAYDRKSLVEDEERCRCAKDILLHPQRRVEAEVTWLFSVPTADVIDWCRSMRDHQWEISHAGVMAYFHYGNTDKEIVALMQMTFLYNVMVHRRSQSHVTLVQGAQLLAGFFAQITYRGVTDAINARRAEAGIPLLQGEAEVTQVMQAYVQEIGDYLWRQIQPLDAAPKRQILADIIESGTDRGTKYANDLIYYLSEQYELDMQRLITDAGQAVSAQLQWIQSAIAQQRFHREMADVLLQRLQQWAYRTYPLRVAAQSKGQDYDWERLLASARNITIDIYNAYGDLELAMRMTEELRQYAAPHAGIRLLLDSDKKMLESWQAEQQQDEQEGQQMWQACQDIVALHTKINQYSEQAERDSASAITLFNDLHQSAMACLEQADHSGIDSDLMQTTKNRVAVVLGGMAIDYGNNTENWTMCLTMLDVAQRYAIEQETVEWVDKNRQIVQRNLEIAKALAAGGGTVTADDNNGCQQWGCLAFIAFIILLILF